ncbi:MAG: phage major capsid protein [Alphaproteobacteria bacterium]|nr:phage major capsid protein [Alphaproteobacteria bacterium]
MNTIAEIAEEVSQAVTELKSNTSTQLTALAKRLDDFERRAARPGGAWSDFKPGGASETLASAEVNAALKRFMRTGDNGHLLELKGMAVGSDPDGGYLSFPVIGPAIVNRVREMSPVRQVARVIALPSGDAYEEPREAGEAAATWSGEQDPRGETQAPTLNMTRIPLEELTANPRVTQKLVDTASFDVAAWLTERLADRFARAEGTAFVTGNGVGRPRGIVTYATAATGDAARPWGTLEHFNTGAAGAFASSNPADVLFELQARLKTGYRPNAAWMMNRRTAAKVRQLKSLQGDYLWAPSVQDGQPDRLLGHPVALAEDMPDMADGALSIAFGDFRAGYTIVDRLGMRLLADPFTSKPHICMFAYKRVGGAVVDFEAIKLLRFSLSG